MPTDSVYLHDHQMRHNCRSLVAVLVLATLLLLTAHSMTAMSQVVDQSLSRFTRLIVLIHQAESAGATSSELAPLVTLLNRALELNEEALRLTAPSDAQGRAELLAQVDEILTTVEAKAAQLQAAASQRRFTDTVLAYVFGAVAALLGIVAYAYGTLFYRRYRVKRTFQMKISPK